MCKQLPGEFFLAVESCKQLPGESPHVFLFQLTLTHLTNKGIPYTWTPDCQVAFDTLKSHLQAPPILKCPDFTAELHYIQVQVTQAWELYCNKVVR